MSGSSINNDPHFLTILKVTGGNTMLKSWMFVFYNSTHDVFTERIIFAINKNQAYTKAMEWLGGPNNCGIYTDLELKGAI